MKVFAYRLSSLGIGMGGSRRGTGPPPTPPGKSEVAIGFLKNSGNGTPREAIVSQRRSVRSSVKYAGDYKEDLKNVRTPTHPLQKFLDPHMIATLLNAVHICTGFISCTYNACVRTLEEVHPFGVSWHTFLVLDVSLFSFDLFSFCLYSIT